MPEKKPAAKKAVTTKSTKKTVSKSKKSPVNKTAKVSKPVEKVEKKVTEPKVMATASTSKPVKKESNALAYSIVFAALVIAGSLAFFGYQMNGGMGEESFNKRVAAGIDAYIASKEQEYANPAPEGTEVVEGDFNDDDAVLGNADAKVTIIEFTDYECPFCKMFTEETYPMIKQNYIDTGKVKMIVRDFPLAKHENAYPAALAAECVRAQKGDAAYFDMHEKIFSRQNDMSAATNRSLAKELGADLASYDKCITEDTFRAEIEADFQAGIEAGVEGTPAFLINNRVVSGAQPYEVFVQVFEEELAK